MLFKCTSIANANIDSMMRIYSQSISNKTWQAECRFIEDLRLFFACKNAFVALWDDCGVAVAAVRCEPYRDGYLITCLETAPEKRRMGYASALLTELINNVPGAHYSHVNKNNRPSLYLHKKLGFEIFLDHAVHVDGSVYSDSYTMKYEKNRC